MSHKSDNHNVVAPSCRQWALDHAAPNPTPLPEPLSYHILISTEQHGCVGASETPPLQGDGQLICLRCSTAAALTSCLLGTWACGRDFMPCTT